MQPGQPQTLTVEVIAATYAMDPKEDVWKRAAESDALMPWGLRDEPLAGSVFAVQPGVQGLEPEQLCCKSRKE